MCSTGTPGPAGGATTPLAWQTLIAEVDAVAEAQQVVPGSFIKTSAVFVRLQGIETLDNLNDRQRSALHGK